LTIFVGNLALTTTEQDLRHLFEPYGTVETVRMMTDRATGRSRLAGRTLTVNEAHQREPCQPRW